MARLERNRGYLWLGLAVGFGVAAAAVPSILAPLNRIWLKIGLALHKVMTPLIMGLLFFLVVTPIGLLMRATGERHPAVEAITGREELLDRPDPAGPGARHDEEPVLTADGYGLDDLLDPRRTAPAKPSMIGLIGTVFVLSGATSLVYQVAWVRTLSLFFGSDVFAAAITLSVFMGGLSLGSWLASRIGDRMTRPLLAYGIPRF